MSQPKLKLQSVLSIPFEENSHIAHIEGQTDCLVFDPGLEPEKIIAALDKAKLQPVAIFNTHGHGDHIGGNGALKKRWPDCKIVIGTIEAAKLTDADLNLSRSFGMNMVSPPADVTLDDGETYSAAGLTLRALLIPGHSSGHMVYVIEDRDPPVVMVGDVIFAGSIGRTDFPDGDFAQLRSGIHEKLFTMPDDTRLFPGHGPATTVGREKRTNPFVGLDA
jgi:hydroxyacylglutathione hydrolase